MCNFLFGKAMKEPFSGAKNTMNYLIYAQDVVAIIIKVVTMLHYRILIKFLTPSDRSILYGHLFDIYLIGVQLMVCFASGIPLWRQFWNLPVNQDLCTIARLWVWMGFVVIAYSFGTLWAVSLCVDEVEAAVETAMINGIDTYYTDQDWKILWDEMQYTKQCCGANTYTDWMEASWMSEVSNAADQSNGWKIYAPFACCKKNFKNCSLRCSPNAQNIGRFAVSMINTRGCLSLFMKHFWRLIYIIFALLLIALKLQCSVYGFLRYILRGECCDPPTIYNEEKDDGWKDDESIQWKCDMSDIDLEALGVDEFCSCGRILSQDATDRCLEELRCGSSRKKSKSMFKRCISEIIH